MILFLSGGGIDWAGAIESGVKIHTSRRALGRITIGTRLQLVVDRFKPTRRVVLDSVCVSTQSILILSGAVLIDGRRLSAEDILALAKNGGFGSVSEMLGYYGDGYSGVLIHWTDKKY